MIPTTRRTGEPFHGGASTRSCRVYCVASVVCGGADLSLGGEPTGGFGTALGRWRSRVRGQQSRTASVSGSATLSRLAIRGWVIGMVGAPDRGYRRSLSLYSASDPATATLRRDPAPIMGICGALSAEKCRARAMLPGTGVRQAHLTQWVR